MSFSLESSSCNNSELDSVDRDYFSNLSDSDIEGSSSDTGAQEIPLHLMTAECIAQLDPYR